MAWQDEMVPMLRYLIDDFGSTLTYTSTRLEHIIAVAAQLSLLDMTFDKSYAIDITQVSITPDPTAETRDDGFIGLVCLKAACIIASAEVKTAAGEGIRVTDGPHTIDLTMGSQIKQTRAKDICAKFEQARKQYLAGNSKAGVAVLGPYTYEGVNPRPYNF
jgi:hypothetical protein